MNPTFQQGSQIAAARPKSLTGDPQPVREQRDIPMGIIQLDNALNEQRVLMAELTKRLQPLIHPEPETPPEKISEPPSPNGLMGAIHMATRMVRATNEDLQLLLRKVEI